MFRPRCGRKLKSQCSPEDLRGQPTQAQASHHDHAGWSPPTAAPDGRTSYASSRSRSLTHRQPPPTTTTKSNSTLRWPSTACASLSARLQPRADDAPSWTWRATTPTPAIPTVRLAAPPPHPATSFPSDTADAGTHGRRGPDTGHLDAQTPASDTGHMDRHPWDIGRSHRTRDTGCRTRTRTP
jgi:hypothetical protein